MKLILKKDVIILTGFIICLATGLLLQFNRESKLKYTKKTIAVVSYRSESLTKGFGTNLSYSVNGKKFDVGIACDCDDLIIGDTVLIKYSIKDPQTILLFDKYYMQKYKGKCDE
jgi:hypothetical protein